MNPEEAGHMIEHILRYPFFFLGGGGERVGGVAIFGDAAGRRRGVGMMQVHLCDEPIGFYVRLVFHSYVGDVSMENTTSPIPTWVLVTQIARCNRDVRCDSNRALSNQ